MSIKVKRLFHPTHLVPDLDEATAFFDRIFGRRSIPLSEFIAGDKSPKSSSYVQSYGTFTPIAEVLFECIDPALLVVDGVQLRESVTEAHLMGLAWFVDGVEELWTEFQRLGLHATDQRHKYPEGDGPPMAYPYPVPIIFTEPEEVGMRYECVEYYHLFDPRGEAPARDVIPSDPLGIESCSHHTILTDRPDRAKHFLVDLLRGQVIAEQRNPALMSNSTYVALGDGVYEVARPLEAGSPAMLDWQQCAPHDTYHSLTWKVRDLDQVSDHLREVGVSIRSQTETLIVTDPADTLGIPWGFTTVSPTSD